MQLKFNRYTMPVFRDPYSAASSISDNISRLFLFLFFFIRPTFIGRTFIEQSGA